MKRDSDESRADEGADRDSDVARRFPIHLCGLNLDLGYVEMSSQSLVFRTHHCMNELSSGMLPERPFLKRDV